MARTRIKNTSNGPLVLPSPLHGILHPSRSVVSSKTVVQLEALFNIDDATGGKSGIRLTDVTADNPDVTTGLESDTIGETAASTEYTPAVSANYPGTDPDDTADALDRLAARTNGWTYGRTRAADAAAADATAESLIERVFRAGTVTAVRYVPTGAVTASDTHYATITVRQRDAAGANPATIATLVTNVAGGSWTAFVAKSLGAITNAAVVAGAILTYQIEKAGDGVVVPDGRLEVVVEPASGA